MYRKYFCTLAILTVLVVAACSNDNTAAYDEPEAVYVPE